MLGFVSGKVVSIYEGTAVVENNGLGFELAVSSNTLDSLKTGADVKLFTYLQLREDGLRYSVLQPSKKKRCFSNSFPFGDWSQGSPVRVVWA